MEEEYYPWCNSGVWDEELCNWCAGDPQLVFCKPLIWPLRYSGCCFHTTSHHWVSFLTCSWIKLKTKGMKMIWVSPSAEAFFWAMLGHRILSCPWRNKNWTERLKCKSVMLQNCRRTKTRSWRPVRKANKTKSCSGESEILSHHCLQTTTLDNRSDAEKFSVLSGEFYNLSAQLTDFDSFLATLWHRFGLLCLYPLSCLLLFLSLPPFTETSTRWLKTTFFTLSPALQAARYSALVEVGALEGSGWCTVIEEV